MFTRARAAAAVVFATGICALIVGVAEASAASVFLCVPATAGQAAVSGGSSASGCAGGTTAVNASILSHASYTDTGIDGKPTITFTGVNVQVVSGSGSTSGAVNGEGNLIVGYAEHPGGHPQSGSNDLILGSNNGWSSYGELVGGSGDQATGAFASVLGDDNTASGAESSVSGGENGLASTAAASVGGGNHDTASGTNGAWVAGGYRNTSNGSSTAVTGGASNTAHGANSSVTGGQYNLASDSYSSVSGGCDGVAGAASALIGACGAAGYESVSGGVINRAQGLFSSVSAGELNDANGYSTGISGGDHNTAGSSSAGNFASVTGGGGNEANGDESTIAGGQYNLATDDNSFVAGGCDNLSGAGTAPTGDCVNSDSGLEDGHDAILGGFTNATTGFGSSVSGGENNDATGSTSSILGGNGVSVSATDKTAPTGVVGSVTGSVGFSLGANACGAFSVGDSALQLGDVPLFAYTTTPPSQNVVFTPGAVTTAGQAKFTACNLSGSSTSFSGSIHLVAFRG